MGNTSWIHLSVCVPTLVTPIPRSIYQVSVFGVEKVFGWKTTKKMHLRIGIRKMLVSAIDQPC